MKQFLRLLLFFITIITLVLSGCKKENSAEKVYKIAFASFGPDIAADLTIKGYVDGLGKAGFTEGKNLEITKFHAAGDMGNIPMMMKNADFKGYDVLVPMTTPCLAAAFAGVKSTRMVFCYVYDPLAAGAGKSFNEHHKLATGIGSFPPLEETFNFIKQIVPGVRRIGVVYNSSEANSRKVVEVGKEILNKMGLELVEVTITGTNEISQASESLCSKDIQAVWGCGDNTVLQGFAGVVKAAKKTRLPLVINDPEFTGEGALAAVGIGWYETGEAAARLAARVLKGEDPKNIPIENVAVKKLIVNNKVAKELNIKVPEEFMAEAEVIN